MMARMRLRSVVVAVGTVSALARAWESSGQTVPTDRVLVMPFENETREARAFWLGEASALLLDDELSALGSAAIDRYERREAFEQLQVPPAAVLTNATVIRVGQLVGASEVVVGAFRLEDHRLVVHARSIVIETGRLRERVSEQGPLSELFGIFERVARGLRPPTARTAAADLVRRRPDVGAFESYVKGLLADSPGTAVSYLTAALTAQPTFERARLALWEVYTGHGEHGQAADEVSRVADDSPLAWRAKFLLGLSQLQLSLNDEAFQTFGALAQLRPTPAVLNNLGVAQLRRNLTVGSGPASYFDRAAQADASEPDFFFNLGYAYWMQRDSRMAIHWLREALRRNPADGEAHFLLGTALSAVGEQAEATRERELARRLSSVFAEWEKRPVSEAIPKGLERIKADLTLPHRSRVDATLTDQRNQQELAAFYVQRGRRLYEQQNDREALADLQRALFLAPYQAEAHLLTGRVHLRAGRISEAIDAFKIAIWSEETAAARAALAEAHLELKDLESARAEAARALELDPAFTEAALVLERAARRDR